MPQTKPSLLQRIKNWWNSDDSGLTPAQEFEYQRLYAAATGSVVFATDNGFEVLIRDPDGHFMFRVPGSRGGAEVVTELVREGETLIMRGTHVGPGATLSELKQAAEDLGRAEGASRVVIEPGMRPARVGPAGNVIPAYRPSPITIKIP